MRAWDIKIGLLLNDFLELMTKQMKGIRMKTNKYAVYVMLSGRSMSMIRGVYGK